MRLVLRQLEHYTDVVFPTKLTTLKTCAVTNSGVYVETTTSDPRIVKEQILLAVGLPNPPPRKGSGRALHKALELCKKIDNNPEVLKEISRW